MVNTTRLDRDQDLTVPHCPAIVGHHSSGDKKIMAIANHNIRYKVTIHKDLLEVIKADAESKGLSISEMMAYAIESHYVSENQYTSQEAHWKRNIKESAN